MGVLSPLSQQLRESNWPVSPLTAMNTFSHGLEIE